MADVPPPIIQIGPTNQTLPVGGVAALPCRATGTPLPRIKWYKDGQPLTFAAPRVWIAQIGSLKIDSTFFARFRSFFVTLVAALPGYCVSMAFHSYCTVAFYFLLLTHRNRFAARGHRSVHVHRIVGEWRDIMVGNPNGKHIFMAVFATWFEWLRSMRPESSEVATCVGQIGGVTLSRFPIISPR